MFDKIKSLVPFFKDFPSLLSIPLVIGFVFLLPSNVLAETITFNNSWGDAGFNLVSQDAAGVEVVFSIEEFALEDMVIDGQTMQMVYLPGVFLPNNAGAPNLPGMGRYIAIPEGASVRVRIVDSKTEIYQGVDLAPAPPIPLETDDSPPVYKQDPAIYSHNAYYPDSPVKISEPTDIRGVDAIIMGITPFQYNPVTRELLVYRDLRVQVDFIGGNGHFGEDRLRSRHWEPILRGNLLNYSSLPAVNFNRINQLDRNNWEYLIIVPDDPAFIAWADSIKEWRTLQGIYTGVVTLAEIGGNNSTLIENYINNAYATWDPAPVAVLLLSDYQSTGDIYGITSPLYSGIVSDNIYADVNGNNLPNIALARITAQNYQHLATMVEKFLDYERDPPTAPNFYDNPLIAGGWQSDRWFIICCEVIYGYMYNELGKRPVRQYAGTSGPPSQWSSNPNTYMIVDYFGPNGLGYIPTTPSHLTNWSGNATGINNAINSGAFITQHRDHGGETGWGSPSYSNPNLSGLSNDMLTFVFSINCLTGKYNWSSECFTEAFHRMEHGALGVIAASGLSYSFVNDTYVWGMYDSMWPDFDPGYGNDPTGPNDLRPCFASAYGKYYLDASNWPYNPGSKVITYHLFHHHGDAFITLYSEVPQNLTVLHQPAMLGGVNEFSVTANEGSIISLTVDGEIIGVAEGTGAPVNIEIEPQVPGDTMLVTITLCNYYRYMQDVPIIPAEGAYVIASECEVVDTQGWNPNSQLDYDENVKLTLTMQNIGVEDATDVLVTISTDDPLLTIIDNSENYGTVAAGSSVSVPEGFEITADPATPDGHNFIINAVATSDSTWESSFVVTGYAPVFVLERLAFSDPTGNNNNWLDPGETADMEVIITNEGSSPANGLTGTLVSLDPLLTINTSTGNFQNIEPGATGSAEFNVTADPSTPQEYIADVELGLEGDHNFAAVLEFGVMIGNLLYDPTGPDNYGYLAYDPFDTPENPVYDWVEISADSGGPGTMVPFVLDDQVFQYALPFNFQYYGVDYDSFSVATNGWIAMGIVTEEDYNNSGIPDPDGPPRMIAPYWEDLSPQRTNSGKVWVWHDEAEHRVIVEYNHIEQYAPTGAFETFQVILLDPEHYQTSTGDGRILFQYKDMSPTAQLEGTIGIENHLQNDGLQYFAGIEGQSPVWDIHAHPIENEFAILFTTTTAVPSLEVTLTPVNPPIIIPPSGGSFDYDLSIENIGGSPVNFDGWVEVVMPNSSVYGPIILRTGLSLNPGSSIMRNMTQNVPYSAPAGDYTYRCNVGVHPESVWASDEFDFSKLGVDANSTSNGKGWLLTGWDDEEGMLASIPIPDDYYLTQNSPNPFNPVTIIAFGLPSAGEVELKVFNLLGREVHALHTGWMTAGHHRLTFDAAGLSSGIYFYMLKTADFTSVKKMLLVK